MRRTALLAAFVITLFAAACGSKAGSGGNLSSADGGTGDDGGVQSEAGADGGGAATVIMCPGYTPGAPAGCTTTAGTGAGTLITGTVLAPGQIFRGGQVAVDGSGHIACVACDCSASAAGAQTIVCPSGVVSPGLINSHDHITYTQDAPLNDTGERYEHR
ncbi:MAG TPA: hypothetical protein VGI39_23265, partial [Polyangiaceae bacterium]